VEGTDIATLAPGVQEPGVAIVARDPSLLRRLARALDSAGIATGGRATGLEELVALGPEVDTVVLYDNRDGAAVVDMVREARAALPDQLLIVVWPASDVGDARRLLRAGTVGLVSESELEATLGATVRAVRAGLICVPSPLRAPLQSEALSMREKQILGMVVMGFTNADIAAELYVAESTVKSHLSSAYTKLGVSSRREARALILDPTQGLGPGIFAIAVGTGAAPSGMVGAESRSRRSGVAPEADGSTTSGADGTRPPGGPSPGLRYARAAPSHGHVGRAGSGSAVRKRARRRSR
jgi:DNA-binding NarL/FixJ family response regulator